MKHYIFPIILILLASSLPARIIYGYFNSYDYSLKARHKQSENIFNTNIDIAVIWDLNDQESFLKGVKLAIKEENKKGITLIKNNKEYKQTIRAAFYDDSTTKNRIKSVHEMTKNNKIVAAIGHSGSSSAIGASVSYEQHGILFLSTVATDQALTNHGFKYVFSTIPTDYTYTHALVNFTQQKEYKKVAVLYSRDNDYGLNLFNNYSSLLHGKDISIVFSRSFSAHQTDFQELIYDMLQSNAQALILGTTEKHAAMIIQQLRTLGIEIPVMGSDGLDNPFIWNMSNKTSNNTYVASIYIDNPYSANKNISPDFYTAFFDNYGYAPDYLALQGYDAVKILAASIRRSNSKSPIVLAATLKYNFKNAYNNYQFNHTGHIMNKHVYIKEMKNGKFFEVLQESLKCTD